METSASHPWRAQEFYCDAVHKGVLVLFWNLICDFFFFLRTFHPQYLSAGYLHICKCLGMWACLFAERHTESLFSGYMINQNVWSLFTPKANLIVVKCCFILGEISLISLSSHWFRLWFFHLLQRAPQPWEAGCHLHGAAFAIKYFQRSRSISGLLDLTVPTAAEGDLIKSRVKMGNICIFCLCFVPDINLIPDLIQTGNRRVQILPD